MTVRVVRVMEYHYDTLEKANEDMARWQVPAVGDKKFGTLGPLVKSTVLLPHYMKEKQIDLLPYVTPEDFVGEEAQLSDPNNLVGKQMTIRISNGIMKED